MDEDRPGDFNQAMMDVGAMICIPNGAPNARAALTAHCKAKGEGTMEKYPMESREEASSK